MSIVKPSTADISSYVTPEILQRQNAEFLEAYPTDDAQIDYYTDLAMKLWDEFEIDGAYDVRGTRVNVATWFESKRKQMELFRKHPYWCEEAKAIIFTFNEFRGCNFNDAKSKLFDIREYIYRRKNYVSEPNGDAVLAAIESSFRTLTASPCDCVQTITPTFINHFNHHYHFAEVPKNIKRMLTVGTKITRLVRKCLEQFEDIDGEIIDTTKLEDEHAPGDRTFDSVEKRFAKFADSLSELTTVKTGIASLNFLDFMTMSNGNSWSSCHYINSHGLFHRTDTTSTYHGAYKQGCLSYALDEPSFIFYTLPADFKGSNYYRQKKINRMCCQYESGALVTGKCYPNNEISLIDKYREMLCSLISVMETSTAEWEVSNDIYQIGKYACTADGAAHYADYTFERQLPSISLCKKIRPDVTRKMTIGHNAYCVYCGTDLRGNGRDWLQCNRHRRKMICAECGKKLNDDMPYHVVGDRVYCGDCVFYCAVHDRYESTSNLYGTILMSDGEKQVCNAGMERLAKCENCGVYGLKSNMLRTTSGYSCKKHVRRYKRCALCGKYVPNKDARVCDNGNAYCDECNEFIHDLSDISLKQKAEYEVGDYVLITEDTHHCAFGFCSEMNDFYANKIVKIEYKGNDAFSRGIYYKVSSLDGDDWSWCRACFVGVLNVANDSFIGKTLDEVRQMTKGE